MNAAAQRRLTPVCAAAVAVFGIAFLSLLFGVGRGVTWNAPRTVPPLPVMHSVALPAPPLLGSYAQVWEHPLFSSDRKPIVTNGGGEGVSIGDLQLTGVIMTPTLHMALLGSAHDNKGADNSKPDDTRDVRVREGAMLPDSSWKLIKVLPRSAIFASPSGRTELKLAAGAPIDQLTNDANSAIPMGGPPTGIQPHMMQPQGMQVPAPNINANNDRLQKLRAAILRQRSQQQSGNAQGAH